MLSDKGRIEKHVKPLLGRMKVAAVTTRRCWNLCRPLRKEDSRHKARWKRGLSNVRGGVGTASRTVGLLEAIFTYAVSIEYGLITLSGG